MPVGRVVKSIGAAGLLATLAMIGCAAPDSTPEQRAALPLYLGTDSMGVAPTDVRSVPFQSRALLIENSAATASEVQPGIMFTINDSGNEPLLFAFDTSGADRGAWRVGGATNNDWESASIGPCVGPDSAAPASGPPRCIYIGDTGDNEERAPSRAIYQLAEPAAADGRFTGTVQARRLAYAYSDHPHDVEAMYVAPNATLYLITKRPLRDARGQRRESLVFAIPPGAWTSGTMAVAQLVDSLSIVPGSAPQRTITDAALSADGRLLAVRTYAQVYVFATDSVTGRIVSNIAPGVCNVAGLRERQGEGIGWEAGTRRLVLTSEGRGVPIRIVSCPLPGK
jgi:hypothetical protein